MNLANQYKKYLILSFFTICIAGIFFGAFLSQTPIWEKEKKRIDTNTTLFHQIFSGKEISIEPLFSYIDAILQTGEKTNFMEGTLDLLTGYNLSLAQTGAVIELGKKTLERAIDSLENASMLATTQAEYDRIEANITMARTIHVIATIKLCFKGLQEGISSLKDLIPFFENIQTVLLEEWNLLMQVRKEKKEDKEFRDCLVQLLQTNKDGQQMIKSYTESFLNEQALLEKEIENKITNPEQCLKTKKFLLSPTLSGGIPEDIRSLYEQHAMIVALLAMHDTSFLTGLCQQQQQDNMQQQKTEQELAQMQQDMEEMKQQEEQQTGQEKKESGHEQKKQLPDQKKEFIERLKQGGEQWYSDVQEKEKNQDYSSQNELDATFQRFDGYAEDFLNKKEQKSNDGKMKEW